MIYSDVDGVSPTDSKYFPSFSLLFPLPFYSPAGAENDPDSRMRVELASTHGVRVSPISSLFSFFSPLLTSLATNGDVREENSQRHRTSPPEDSSPLTPLPLLLCNINVRR